MEAFFSNFEAYIPCFYALKMERLDFIQTGDAYDCFLYYYVRGKFKVYAELENGRRKLLRFCEGPMLLGEMELLLYKEEMSCCIEAVDSGLVLVLDYTSVREKLMSDVRFLRWMCESFAEKMAYFGKRQTANAVLKAEEKVWDYLRHSVDDTGIFKTNLRVVAEELDISYRHLHRILNGFVRQGIVDRLPDGSMRIQECD